jgi:hypothetical protein
MPWKADEITTPLGTRHFRIYASLTRCVLCLESDRFYLLAVAAREAIMAGNVVRIAKTRTPLCGVFQKGKLCEITGQESKRKGMYYGIESLRHRGIGGILHLCYFGGPVKEPERKNQ